MKDFFYLLGYGCVTLVMMMPWWLRLSIVLVIGFAVGLGAGYGLAVTVF